MLYFYIIRSRKDKSLYVGQTKDLDARLFSHSRGACKRTRNRCPWELIFYVKLNNRAEVKRIQRHIKPLKNPEYILEWMRLYINKALQKY